MNLNNLARGLRKVYAPRRRSLVKHMEQDGEWEAMGHRFKVFQRSETGQNRPSEWMIVAFALWQLWRAGSGVVRRAWRSLGASEAG